jgi:hypothetical protein
MKLQFEPFDEEMGLLFERPRPAAQSIPGWYKDMPVHMDGEKETGLNKESVAVSNLTLKGCNPFLDALTSGYIFTLPFDIEFRRDYNGSLGIRWATNINFIGGHGADQAPGLPGPIGGTETLLKWRPGWRIITPKGYSALFTHPLNRHDLPFRTFSGVVDTDMYELGVEFPFQLLNTIDKDIFILEKGTPICQVIPFKRENWESEEVPFDEKANKVNGFKLKSKIVRSYKSQFWQKKTYR